MIWGIDFGTSTTLLSHSFRNSVRSFPLGSTTNWIPSVAVENDGRIVAGEEALQFLKSLAHTHETWMADTTRHPDSPPPTTTSVFQTLSTILQREIARIIHTYTQKPEAYAEATV
jgi:hypothetical protein